CSSQNRNRILNLGLIIEDNLIENVPYDGPDDIDRYLGHGEFDDDSGYYLCD
ncbi:2829_t:CDS:1, partial [Funneliformis caledonium]